MDSLNRESQADVIEVFKRVSDETVIVETAVWPILFLISVFTALKGSQF